MSEERDGTADAVSEDTTVADLAAEDTATEQDADTGDEAAAETEGEGAKPKKPTAQERFDELTRLRREAEREAEYWKAKATQPATEKPAEREQPKEDTRPDPADFQFGETDPGFIEALGAFAARKEFMRLSQEAEQKTQARTVEQTWNDRQQAFAKDKPDYYEVLDRKWDCSAPMADAIRTSEVGAAVAYHLASNPEEARRIAGLNPLAAIREIGRLEARFDTKSGGPAPKPASDAPPPPPQVRGQGGRFKVAPDTEDFAAFESQYK